MIGEVAYGEGEYGEASGAPTNIVLISKNLFINGFESTDVSISAHIRAFTNTLANDGIPVYINGHSYAQNTENGTWGTVTDGLNRIVNSYKKQLAYVNQVVTPLTSNRTITIVNYGIIMRLLTRDGNADIYTNILDDSSSINNDGAILNSPTWIVGPHG